MSDKINIDREEFKSLIDIAICAGNAKFAQKVADKYTPKPEPLTDLDLAEGPYKTLCAGKGSNRSINLYNNKTSQILWMEPGEPVPFKLGHHAALAFYAREIQSLFKLILQLDEDSKVTGLQEVYYRAKQLWLVILTKAQELENE